MLSKICQVYNVNSSLYVSRQTVIADTFLTRLIGLLLTKKFKPGSGLIIEPCKSIHMFFMRYPIDVIFYNQNLEIVALVENIQPWQFTKVYSKAKACLELPINSIRQSNSSINDQLKIEFLN